MPSVSKKQAGLMRDQCGPRKAGDKVPRSVACEFVNADARKAHKKRRRDERRKSRGAN